MWHPDPDGRRVLDCAGVKESLKHNQFHRIYAKQYDCLDPRVCHFVSHNPLQEVAMAFDKAYIVKSLNMPLQPVLDRDHQSKLMN